MEGVLIRPMRSNEVGIAIDWAAAEGWNPSVDDGGIFHRADPEGFIVAEHDGDVVGTASVVRYDGYSFYGLYLVRPDMRGRGIGMSLYHQLRSMHSGTAIFDGVMAMVPKYETEGFRQAFQSVRFRMDDMPSAPEGGTMGVDDVPFDELVAYDSRTFMSSRPSFLLDWFDSYGGSVVHDGGVRGFGTLRPCIEGHKIGPLFADTPEVALALLRDLTSDVDGPVFIDVPLPNLDALSIVRSLRGEEVFRCARMYSSMIPAFPLGRIYGITTFELG